MAADQLPTTSKKRTLLSLPPELLELITDSLYSSGLARSLSNLARTSRALFNIVNPALYRFNMIEGECSALQIVGYRGGVNAAQRFFSYVPHRQKRNPKFREVLLRAAGDCLVDASRQGNIKLVQLLMRLKGIDLNHRSRHGNGNCALLEALCYRETEIAMLLLRQKSVKRGMKDKRMRTPLHWAAWQGYYGILKELLTETGHAPLSRGPRHWSWDFMAPDAEDGIVDPNLPDKGGAIPLRYAVQKGSDWIVEMLLDKISISEALEDFPQLVRAAVTTCSAAMVKRIIDLPGVDPDRKDAEGRTALTTAICKSAQKIVEVLIDSGKVDVNSQDCWGRTPISRAVECANDSIAKLLLKHGAKPDVCDYRGEAPLTYAVHRGRKNLFGLLLGS